MIVLFGDCGGSISIDISTIYGHLEEEEVYTFLLQTYDPSTESYLTAAALAEDVPARDNITIFGGVPRGNYSMDACTFKEKFNIDIPDCSYGVVFKIGLQYVTSNGLFALEKYDGGFTVTNNGTRKVYCILYYENRVPGAEESERIWVQGLLDPSIQR